MHQCHLNELVRNLTATTSQPTATSQSPAIVNPSPWPTIVNPSPAILNPLPTISQPPVVMQCISKGQCGEDNDIIMYVLCGVVRVKSPQVLSLRWK